MLFLYDLYQADQQAQECGGDPFQIYLNDQLFRMGYYPPDIMRFLIIGVSYL